RHRAGAGREPAHRGRHHAPRGGGRRGRLSVGGAVPTLIGSPVSPYVRKVLAACAVKGIEVAVDPVTPFLGDDSFGRLSPLRRIPVWIEGDLTLCDSSVIVQYLEETRPGPSLWP